MNFPSVKRIQAVLSVDAEKAKQIRAVMQETRPMTAALDEIDDILGTCGVEYIPRGYNQKSPAIEYCNTGDTYRPTVMFVRGRFVLGCWGDIVERGRYD